MAHDALKQPDFGTGEKKLGMYFLGFISCSLLTLISFWSVTCQRLPKSTILAIIFSSACIQFILQVVCFLRLSTQTAQGKTNIMTLLFTGVVLTAIILGSLWIMWNLNYDMMH